MNTEIEVCERLADYWIDESGEKMPKFHAQIKGEAGVWACGRSIDDAIGNLVRYAPERFSVDLSYLGKLHR